MLKKGHRHNPIKEAKKLIEYLERNPNFRGVAICMLHGTKTVTCLTAGNLHGGKAEFKREIMRHVPSHETA